MVKEIGDKVRAIDDQPYMTGAGYRLMPENKIKRGELVTISRTSGGDLYFQEHEDRYGGWQEFNFIPDGMLWCNDCGNAVSEILRSLSFKLSFVDGKWVKVEEYCDEISCPICSNELDFKDLDTFGMKLDS